MASSRKPDPGAQRRTVGIAVLVVSTYLVMTANGGMFLLVVSLKQMAGDFDWPRTVPSLAYALFFAGADDEPVSARGRTPMSWMQRLRYMVDIDLRRCPRCGAALRVLAVITDPRVIATIVEHINNRAARAPPIASS